MEKKKYTIKEIVKQLEFCGFECIAGCLEMNTAFIALKEIANSNYQTNHYIGEEMYADGKKVNICRLSAESSDTDYQIKIGVKDDMPAPYHYGGKEVEYTLLETPEEYKNRKIKEAKKVLEDYAILPQ